MFTRTRSAEQTDTATPLTELERAYSAAEIAGYVVAPDPAADNTDPTTPPLFAVIIRRAVDRAGLTYEQAMRRAIERHQTEQARTDELAEQARMSSREQVAREQARARLQVDADRLNSEFPDLGPVDVHAGAWWWGGRSWHSLDAIKAEMRIYARREASAAEFRDALEQAIAAAGYSARLTTSDEIDQRANHRTEWAEQVIDLMAPLHHPAAPTDGDLKAEAGLVVVETCTRADAAQSFGVPWPETIDDRAARRNELARIRAEHRAAATEAAEGAEQRAEQARAAAEGATP